MSNSEILRSTAQLITKVRKSSKSGPWEKAQATSIGTWTHRLATTPPVCNQAKLPTAHFIAILALHSTLELRRTHWYGQPTRCRAPYISIENQFAFPYTICLLYNGRSWIANDRQIVGPCILSCLPTSKQTHMRGSSSSRSSSSNIPTSDLTVPTHDTRA